MKQEIIIEFIYCFLTMALMLSLGLIALEQTVSKPEPQVHQTITASLLG